MYWVTIRLKVERPETAARLNKVVIETLRDEQEDISRLDLEIKPVRKKTKK